MNETPEVATSDLVNPNKYLTPLGGFIRKSSIDEIPQLYSVLIGHMSLIGPRPALFSQSYLIERRTLLGISELKPGISGWAQVNGRDEISIDEKIKFDLIYYKKRSLFFDLKIIYLTFCSLL